MTKTKVHSTGKTKEKKVEIPTTLQEKTYRTDLIQRAHKSERSNKYQPKGTDPRAGFRTSAEYRGRRGVYGTTRNIGRAKLPRIIHPGGRIGQVKRVPQSRGGHRAHPPKPEKKIKKQINQKERKKALKEALKATTDREKIEKRGHLIPEDLKLPIIVDNEVEKYKKTQKVTELLEKIGLEKDLEKSREKKTRAGKGKARGRRKRQRKTALIVTQKDNGVKRATRNIPGAEATTVKQLSIEQLAPGGQPGRLTIYTENALKEIKKIENN